MLKLIESFDSQGFMVKNLQTCHDSCCNSYTDTRKYVAYGCNFIYIHHITHKYPGGTRGFFTPISLVMMLILS